MAYQLIETNKKAPLMILDGINVKYGAVTALKNVSLELYSSEIHAVVGEHASGKSTLGLVLSGFMTPQSGKILWDKKPCSYFPRKAAKKFGIQMVMQHTQLCKHLSIANNFLIYNKKINSNMLLKKKSVIIEQVNAFIKKCGFDYNSETLVMNLSIPETVLIDILRNIFTEPKLLILDEVLEKLTEFHLRKIIILLQKLKEEGLSILFISHSIDKLFELADRVTIIRNGEGLVTDSVKNIDKINIIRLAYTQINQEERFKGNNEEFYQLLKYNQAILETFPANLIVIDKNNKIKLMNDYAKEFFKIENSFYINMPLKKLFDNKNAQLLNLIEAAVQKNVKETFINQPIRLENSIYKTNIITYPLSDGFIDIGNMIIVEDVTEQEKLREKVILSEKLASIGLLAAGVAHEINNPLEIIYNYLDYLKIKMKNSNLIKTVQNLEEEIGSIKHIISNLISFSSIKSDIYEAVDINELLDNTISLVRHDAIHRNITLNHIKKADPLRIKTNKTEIRQVMLNLIKNSFEAMPGGGSLTIQTDLIHAMDKNEIEIIFQDTGKGIELENINDIFLPFYSTKKGSKENLGLGLSVSYGIITKFNGNIKVENLKKNGCRFVISLPVNL